MTREIQKHYAPLSFYFENQEIPVLTGISGGGDFNPVFPFEN